MLVPGSVNPLLLTSAAGAAGGGVSRSLRFNSPDSAHLSRTPASAGNRRTWTWAGWVKRSGLGGDQQLIYAAPSSTDTSHIRFDDDNTLHVFEYTTGFVWQVKTSQVFRDTSSWYHIVVSVDTAQATASNRVKIYVNGTQVTAFGTATYPSQNADTEFNNTVGHAIGRNDQGASNYFSGYLADIYFIDGQALTPSSFTETDATTGQLIPKAYTGSYGTNGFHLEFSDNSGTTSTTLGKDSAGSNNWTPNNFSVSSGAGNDSLVDVPTNGAQTDTGVGGEVRGNYCVLNPLSLSGTLTNGNLDLSTTTVNAQPSTFFFSSGKWYWETTISSNGGSDAYIRAGVCNQAGVGQSLGATANGWCFLGDGRTFNNGSAASYGVAITTGDVLNIALDIDAGKLWYGKNGTWMASGNPATGANPSQTFTAGTALSPAYAAGGGTVVFNFNAGARPFAYTAPSGFKALNTANLPAPLVTKPNTVMDVKLWTGTGSTLSVTGLSFNPDLVWIKPRSNGGSNNLFDAVRGVEKYLLSDSTLAENGGSSGTGSLTSFNSDGFTLGTASYINTNNYTYVGWCWDAGSSTDTNNTAGTITPTGVRANATAGFSVVTYTGNGSSSQTIGHGLGAAPAMVIVKRRDSATNWNIWFTGFTSNEYILLNTTGAKATFSGQWGSTPTSTVFGVGSDGSVNASGSTYVAYCFAPVVGYSSFGSFSGSNTSDGPFVYLGFRPRLLWVKCTQDIAGDVEQWVIKDTARSSYNEAFDNLYANLSNAEDDASGSAIDILSNGFKLRGTYGGINGSATYIYCAWAESPFNYARAR